MVPDMERIIFRETTTLGIRKIAMEGCRLKREALSVSTSLGPVQAKRCRIPAGNGTVENRVYPEYESIRRLCKTQGRSYQEVSRIVTAELNKIPF